MLLSYYMNQVCLVVGSLKYTNAPSKAPFHQHMHMEYISLRSYDNRERVAPIRIYVIEDTANTEGTETRVPFGKGEIITSKILRSPP